VGKVSLTLETTDAQDESLTWLLTTINGDAVHLEKPLPDVSALLMELLQTVIEDVVPRCQAHRKSCITEALDKATLDQWAKVADVLGVKDLPGDDAGAAVSAVVA